LFWAVLIVVGGSLASKIGSVENDEAQTWLPANAQSTQALGIADKYFSDSNISTAVVVYARSSGLTAGDKAKVEADRSQFVAQHLAAGGVQPVTFSADNQAALVTVPLRSSKNDNNVLGHGVDRLRKLAQTGAPDGLNIKIAGQAGNVADYIHVFSGLNSALLAATIAIVALLLLLIYRSPVLWLVPLLSVGLASQVASAVVYLLAKHAGLLVNGLSASVLTVLVLGVGTDYALLLIARYREELRRHEDRHEAMAVALRRCLPAIAASAGTVIIATLCLVFGSMNSTRGLGPVAAVGVAVAFLAMTTLLPALLVVVGRWAFWPFIPRYSPQAQATSARSEHGVWSRVSGIVGRAPRPIWVGTALVLAALAFGSITLTSGQTQADQFTKKVDSVAGQQLLAQHFPAGSSAPADVYVPAADTGPALAVVKSVAGVTSAHPVGTSGGWAHITAVLRAQPDTTAAQQTIQRIRSALGQTPGGAAAALVGGQSAVALDTANARASEEKLLIPVILAVVLVVLIMLLRAVIAPVLLLLSVVLSYAAAVGAAALLFRALGHPRIDRGLLLFGFLFLVALGVDYTIFLMTRVREEVHRHGHRQGVLTGLTVTGGVITSAGLVLTATFSVLAVLPVVQSLQEGLLIAVGVLLDTFLVRSLLIPALAIDVGARIWRPGHPERSTPDDPSTLQVAGGLPG
jgi:RND superfamily putative drug exporter